MQTASFTDLGYATLVVGLIWLGVAIYLLIIDRRISRIEKDLE